ncbi:MAG: hypothetical protein N2645_19420 [Clostridia bacterium]|nr:hypothetical protein [Clostridia bacterium]
MGAITAAVSQKGAKYFLSDIMLDTIKNCLEQQVIDHEKIPNTGKIMGTYVENITVDMYNGKTSNVNVSFDDSGFVQSDNGQFSLQFNSSFDVKFDRWHEKGRYTVPDKDDPQTINFDDDCHDQFHFSVDSLPYHVNLVLSINGGNFVINVTGVTKGNIHDKDIHIPSDSEIAGIEDNSCVSDRFLDGINKHFVEGIDFTVAIKDALNSKLAFIPNSGHLTPDIIFEFAPDQIAFPKDGSGNNFTQGSVSGRVSYKGGFYPGQMPDTPPQPQNIPDKHIHFNAQDYVFNGLFWAFYSEGDLKMEVVPSMLADPEEMNTSYYKDTYPAIYKFAPNCPMVVDVEAIAAPTQQNQTAYEVTDATIQNLSGKVPADILHTLETDMKGEIYISLEDFESDLNAFLGADNYKLYGNLIVGQSHSVASIVTHTMKFDAYAYKPDASGNPQKTFMFEANVSQTDYLNQYVLGVRNNAQTLQFYFQLHSASAVLVKSDVPGLTKQDDFNSFWTFVIRPEMAKTIQKMGDEGVALPFIKGYLFQNATVNLFQGYTSIATDVKIG